MTQEIDQFKLDMKQKIESEMTILKENLQVQEQQCKNYQTELANQIQNNVELERRTEGIILSLENEKMTYLNKIDLLKKQIDDLEYMDAKQKAEIHRLNLVLKQSLQDLELWKDR